MGTLIHMCVSVRGLLRKTNTQLNGMMINDDGKKLTGSECRDVLMDKLADGWEVLPMGKCDNFDKKKGCKGHPYEESIDKSC